MIRYYGWYSNPPEIRAGKSRGLRKKHGILKPGEPPEQEPVNLVPGRFKRRIEIIDVSDYKPPRMLSKIVRVYQEDI